MTFLAVLRTPHFLLFMPVNMCHMDFDDKSTGWTRPPCQKEYVDAVHLRPASTPDYTPESATLWVAFIMSVFIYIYTTLYILCIYIYIHKTKCACAH